MQGCITDKFHQVMLHKTVSKEEVLCTVSSVQQRSDACQLQRKSSFLAWMFWHSYLRGGKQSVHEKGGQNPS